MLVMEWRLQKYEIHAELHISATETRDVSADGLQSQLYITAQDWSLQVCNPLLKMIL